MSNKKSSGFYMVKKFFKVVNFIERIIQEEMEYMTKNSDAIRKRNKLILRIFLFVYILQTPCIIAPYLPEILQQYKFGIIEYLNTLAPGTNKHAYGYIMENSLLFNNVMFFRVFIYDPEIRASSIHRLIAYNFCDLPNKDEFDKIY